MVIIAGQGIGTDFRRITNQQKAAGITFCRYRSGDQAGFAQIIIGNQSPQIARRGCR